MESSFKFFDFVNNIVNSPEQFHKFSKHFFHLMELSSVYFIYGSFWLIAASSLIHLPPIAAAVLLGQNAFAFTFNLLSDYSLMSHDSSNRYRCWIALSTLYFPTNNSAHVVLYLVHRRVCSRIQQSISHYSFCLSCLWHHHQIWSCFACYIFYLQNAFFWGISNILVTVFSMLFPCTT